MRVVNAKQKQQINDMAKLIQRINANASIKGMEVGESLVFPFQKVKPVTIRSNVSRLKKSTGRDYKITQNSIGSKTTVTRLK